MSIPGRDPALWNLALLDEAIGRIEADPEHWKQGDWRCSTGCCLAGQVALAAGAQWASDDPEDHEYEKVLPAGGDEPAHVAGYALAVLRMQDEELCYLLDDERDYRDLFDGGNTLADIKAMADDLHSVQDAAKAAQS